MNRRDSAQDSAGVSESGWFRLIMVLYGYFSIAGYIIALACLVFLVLPGRGDFLTLAKNRLWLAFLVQALHIPGEYIALAAQQSFFERPLAVSEKLQFLLRLLAVLCVAELVIYGLLLFCEGFKSLAAVYGCSGIIGVLDSAVMGALGHGFGSARGCLFYSPAILLVASGVCCLYL